MNLNIPTGKLAGSNEMPYGDWDNRALAVDDGFQRLAGQMRDRRIMPGVWYGKDSYWLHCDALSPDLLAK